MSYLTEFCTHFYIFCCFYPLCDFSIYLLQLPLTSFSSYNNLLPLFGFCLNSAADSTVLSLLYSFPFLFLAATSASQLTPTSIVADSTTSASPADDPLICIIRAAKSSRDLLRRERIKGHSHIRTHCRTPHSS